jgi:lipopolysaccharide/colanic/teichoic acid biosynthesis glycosyltransferase
MHDVHGYYRKAGKRGVDLVVSAALLVLLAPLLALIWLLVRWTMGRPALFTQIRPGLHGTAFRLYKFRTMTNQRGQGGEPLSDAVRLTRLGGFLRATSLDELPELWNVLRGDMSLVGPRPLLKSYLQRYSARQSRRHEMRPGLTGWAQINGRQTISFSRRLEYDVWYVDHCSWRVDLKILITTAIRVLRREGVILGQDVRDVDDLGPPTGARHFAANSEIPYAYGDR